MAPSRTRWAHVGQTVAPSTWRCSMTCADAARTAGIPLIVPKPGLCTDNGAMIGAAGARRWQAGVLAGLDLDARPSMPLAHR